MARTRDKQKRHVAQVGSEGTMQTATVREKGAEGRGTNGGALEDEALTAHYLAKHVKSHMQTWVR